MKTREPYILGVDIGTSSSKALAWTKEGRSLCQHQIPHHSYQPEKDAVEQNPKKLLQAAIGVIRSVTEQMEAPPQAVSFSFAMHGIMAVDKKGVPSSALLLWNDNRSKKEAAALKDRPEGLDLYLHTGTPIHSMSPFCKLLWWKKAHPHSFSRADHFISFQEYLFALLFGKGYFISYSLASATGLFDYQTLRWYPPALEYIGISEHQLAEPLPSTQIFRGLVPEYARLLGLRPNTPFILGAGDGCLANLGSGVVTPRQMALTIGTSGAVRITDSQPIHAKNTSDQLFHYLLTEKEIISGGAINNGGNLLDWYKDHFREGEKLTYSTILKEAFQSPAGCHGLLFLPYLYGERAPMWDPDARGGFWGITHNHKRDDFTRAMIEGISYALLHNAEILTSASSQDISQIHVSGGFIRSEPWVQMLADIFQKEMVVRQQEDISSMGAVFLALKALGEIQNWSEIDSYLSGSRYFTPRKQFGSIYRRNFSLFSKMYQMTKEAMHEIAQWQDVN